jgi:hypothetical protein
MYLRIIPIYLLQFSQARFLWCKPQTYEFCCLLEWSEWSKFRREWFDTWIRDVWKWHFKSLNVWIVMNLKISHVFCGLGKYLKIPLSTSHLKFSIQFQSFYVIKYKINWYKTPVIWCPNHLYAKKICKTASVTIHMLHNSWHDDLSLVKNEWILFNHSTIDKNRTSTEPMNIILHK